MLTNQHVTLNIPKHIIDKKFMQKKTKMWNGLSKIKNYNNHVI